MLPWQRGTGGVCDHQSNPTENTEGHSREREKKYQDFRNSGRKASMSGAGSRMKEKTRQTKAEK